MKLPSPSFWQSLSPLVTGFAILAAGPVCAGPQLDSKAVTVPQETRPWSFSAGVIVRSIDADFHLSPPRPLNFGGLLRSGGGDVGLFRTGDRRRDYDNGSVVGFQEFIPGAPSNIPQALTFGGDIRVTGGTGAFFVVPFAEF